MVKRKEVSPVMPLQEMEVTPQKRVVEIANVIEKEILNLNQGIKSRLDRPRNKYDEPLKDFLPKTGSNC